MSKWQVIFLVLLCAFTASCDGPPLLVVYNNTGMVLDMHIGNTSFHFMKDSSIEYSPYDARERIIRISDEHNTWDYEIKKFPTEYIHPGTMRLAVIHIQIEPDRRIYIINSEDSLPAIPPPPQPDGFPLSPMK
jgi:hypothetical protein